MFIFSHVVRYDSVKVKIKTHYASLLVICYNSTFSSKTNVVLLNVQTNIRVILKLTHYSNHTVLDTHKRFI